MKKVGFTLAEVLIVLAIIGVVSALTIPALMQKTQDAELKTALKKTTAELSAATNSLIQENGGTAKGIFNTTEVYDDPSLLNAYLPYLKTTKNCTNARAQGCWHPLSSSGGNWKAMDGEQTDTWGIGTGVILSNGALVDFTALFPDCSGSVCAYIVADVNGFKPPNITGKDVFYFYLLENRLVPYGVNGSSLPTCDASSSGRYCTASKLTE